VELPRIVEDRVPPVRLDAVRVAQEAVVASVVRNFPLLPVCVGSALRVAQDALVPSVVKNLPELEVCVGRLTGAAAHLRPVA
jgi:hypothetical protein